MHILLYIYSTAYRRCYLSTLSHFLSLVGCNLLFMHIVQLMGSITLSYFLSLVGCIIYKVQHTVCIVGVTSSYMSNVWWDTFYILYTVHSMYSL